MSVEVVVVTISQDVDITISQVPDGIVHNRRRNERRWFDIETIGVFVRHEEVSSAPLCVAKRTGIQQ